MGIKDRLKEYKGVFSKEQIDAHSDREILEALEEGVISRASGNQALIIYLKRLNDRITKLEEKESRE